MNVSWELKRLFMAEIVNEDEGGVTPATLDSTYESLESGYEPYDDFPVETVRFELLELLRHQGNGRLATSFITNEDWLRRSKE